MIGDNLIYRAVAGAQITALIGGIGTAFVSLNVLFRPLFPYVISVAVGLFFGAVVSVLTSLKHLKAIKENGASVLDSKFFKLRTFYLAVATVLIGAALALWVQSLSILVFFLFPVMFSSPSAMIFIFSRWERQNKTFIYYSSGGVASGKMFVYPYKLVTDL